MLANWDGQGAQSLQGATLVLPVVSVGNTGQLAADLLINTLRLPRAARLADAALLPAVGGRPFAHVQGLATALELYQAQAASSSGGAVAVAQQRAPAAPGTQAAFAQRLAAFVRHAGVKQVLVLGSIEAGLRRDAQLVGPQLRCWAPEAAHSDAAAGAAAAGNVLLERCRGAAVPPLEPSFFEDRPLEARALQPWPLLRALRDAGVPCAALLCFSAEGDNVAEAFQLAAAAAGVAGLPAPAGGEDEAAAAPQWVPPHTWQHLFGTSTAVY